MTSEKEYKACDLTLSPHFLSNPTGKQTFKANNMYNSCRDELPSGTGSSSEEMSEDEEMSPQPSGPQKRIEVVEWNGNALWSYVDGVYDCAICRNNIRQQCIECQSNEGSIEDCPVSFGKCNHGYHFHCISRWLHTRNVCPLDNQAWEFKKQ